jgi:hypothetical protein
MSDKLYFSCISDPEEFPDSILWFDEELELNELQYKHLHDAIKYGTGFMKISTPEKITNGCDHKWKLYQGFSETYNYCEKCDEKRV